MKLGRSSLSGPIRVFQKSMTLSCRVGGTLLFLVGIVQFVRVKHDAAGDVEGDRDFRNDFGRVPILAAGQEEDKGQDRVHRDAQHPQEGRPHGMDRHGILEIHHADIEQGHNQDRQQHDQPGENIAEVRDFLLIENHNQDRVRHRQHRDDDQAHPQPLPRPQHRHEDLHDEKEDDRRDLPLRGKGSA